MTSERVEKRNNMYNYVKQNNIIDYGSYRN